MPCYIETGHSGRAFPAVGPTPLLLVSGAFGVKLLSSADALMASSDESGWLHVSRSQKDKAAVGKSRRVFAGQHRELAGIGGGMFVSFIADGHGVPDGR